jgi:hypothetical protein
MRRVSCRQRSTSSEEDLDLSAALVAAAEPGLTSIEPAVAVERSGRDLELALKVVQVPAKPVLDARTLTHEILAVVVQEPDLALLPRQESRRQIRLAQEGTRDRKRVDRIRLASCACPLARVRHQLRRHPHDALPAGEQEALERAGDVPAVLERPHPLGVK